jgi:hypothetical protein
MKYTELGGIKTAIYRASKEIDFPNETTKSIEFYKKYEVSEEDKKTLKSFDFKYSEYDWTEVVETYNRHGQNRGRSGSRSRSPHGQNRGRSGSRSRSPQFKKSKIKKSKIKKSKIKKSKIKKSKIKKSKIKKSKIKKSKK